MAGIVDGAVVVVTGGGSGIGRASALRFAREGAAHVVVVDLDATAAAATVDLMEAAGSTVAIDVSDAAAVEALYDGVVREQGRIDIAFNNAGINDTPSSFHELSVERWQHMIDVNLTSVFLCMKSELRHMAAAGSGRIVNTSSGAGLVAAPWLAHYTAAKHGVVGLTRAAATEYGRQGIRVNAVLPGSTNTTMMQNFMGNDENMRRMIEKSSPTGALLEPEDIAEAVVWLGSNQSSQVNGQSLVIDGGGICH